MDFFDRYNQICQKQNIDPCAKGTADRFGIYRSAVSAWKLKGAIPRGDTVAKVATELGVTSDYLLHLSDEPAGYMPIPEPDDSLVPTGYEKLDEPDRIRVEAYIEGLLTNSKYQKK